MQIGPGLGLSVLGPLLEVGLAMGNLQSLQKLLSGAYSASEKIVAQVNL